MTIQRMDHVGVVVDDLEAATAFFVELGLELEGEAAVEDVGWTASSGSTMSESTSQWCGLRTATAGLS
jgi:catechol 2,3-dioxygenase-like lactoylglutathione lyase family enzyme